MTNHDLVESSLSSIKLILASIPNLKCLTLPIVKIGKGPPKFTKMGTVVRSGGKHPQKFR